MHNSIRAVNTVCSWVLGFDFATVAIRLSESSLTTDLSCSQPNKRSAISEMGDVWPQYTWPKIGSLCPLFFGGGSGSWVPI